MSTHSRLQTVVSVMTITAAVLCPESATAQETASAFYLRTVIGAQSCGGMDGVPLGRLCGGTQFLRRPDGQLWLLDEFGLRRWSATGVISTAHRLPSATYSGVAAGPDDQTIYLAYSSGTSGFISRYHLPTRRFTFVGEYGARPLIAGDATGGIYVAAAATRTIHYIDATGVSSIVAGVDTACAVVDGAGTAARFCDLAGLAVAADGTAYVTDNVPQFGGVGRVRKVTRAGMVTTLAEVSPPWRSDAAQGITFQGLGALGRVAIDAQGRVVVESRGYGRFGGGGSAWVWDARILRIDAAGLITVLAGYPGDQAYVDGPASRARIRLVSAMLPLPDGSLVFTEGLLNIVRRLNPDGSIVTLAGAADPFWTYAGPDYRGVRDHPYAHTGMIADADGTLHFLETSSSQQFSSLTMSAVIQLSPEGARTVTAGMLYQNGSVDGAGSAARFDYPRALARGPDGHLYVGDLDGSVRQVTDAGVVTTVVSGAGCREVRRCFSPIDGAMTADSGGVYQVGTQDLGGTSSQHQVRQITTSGAVATFATVPADIAAQGIRGIAADRTGNFYLTAGTSIYKLRGDRVFERLTGGVAGYVDGALSDARFTAPRGILVARDGSLYVGDVCILRKISPAGVVSTVAGRFDACTSEDGLGVRAMFGSAIHQIAEDAAGNLYVTGFRKVTPTGLVTTMQPGARDGVGTAALLNQPRALTRGADGHLYFGDYGVLRRATAAGVVTTIAGLPNTYGFDDDAGVRARFARVDALAADAEGLLIGDLYAVRRASYSGSVRTVAGHPAIRGNTDGPAATARFGGIGGLVRGADGTVYLSDSGNNTIRAISPDGVVSTLAGSAAGEMGAVDGQGSDARFRFPAAIVIGPDGALYVADAGNAAIRRVTLSGEVTTWAGALSQRGNVDGARTAARFMAPNSLVVTADGTWLVGDMDSATIRRIGTDGRVTSLFSDTNAFGDYMAGWFDGAGVDARMNPAAGLALGDAGSFWVLTGSLIRHALPVVPPVITRHPQSLAALPGLSASFAVEATGELPAVYQWEFSYDGATWASLTEGVEYGGTTTATLTIQSVRELSGGMRLRCVVTNAAGAVASNPAMLSLRTPLVASPGRLNFGASRRGATITALSAAQTVSVTHLVPGGRWDPLESTCRHASLSIL